MTTDVNSEDSLNIDNAIITLIVVVGFCICILFGLCLWRRQRENTVASKKVEMVAVMQDLDNSTRTPRIREEPKLREPKSLVTKNEQMVPYSCGWPAVARRKSGNHPRDFSYIEDEDFNPRSPARHHNRQTFLCGKRIAAEDVASIQPQSCQRGLSCECEVEKHREYMKILIREDVTPTFSSDSSTNHYPSIIVNPNCNDCSIKIDGITKGKLFAERSTSSATTGFQSPALHFSRSGSFMFDQRNIGFWLHGQKSKLFNVEAFSPMIKDNEYSFEVPDRPQSIRPKKTEETQSSVVYKSRSLLDWETDTSLCTTQSVFRERCSCSRKGYFYTSEASGTGISVISESLRPVLPNEENFSKDRQYKLFEDGQYKRSDDASSNPHFRRDNEDHNGRTSWQLDQSIVSSSSGTWRSRNNKGLSIPHRQSNGWLNRQGEKSTEKLSASKSDHLIIPANYRREGGIKANKQQLPNEEEESWNPNLRAGGSGLRSNNSGRDQRGHPIESKHKESSTVIDYFRAVEADTPDRIQPRGEEVESESRLKLPKLRMIMEEIDHPSYRGSNL